MPSYRTVWSIPAGAMMFAAAAAAQEVPAPFCAAVGAYMHDIAVQRDAGLTKDEALAEVVSEFTALATDDQDRINRRRSLEISGPMATFAFDLAGLAPTTVQQVGEAYCLDRGGEVSLAPATARAAQIAGNSRACEERAQQSSVALDACVTQAIETRTARVVDRSRPEAAARAGSRIAPFYEFALSSGGDPIGTILFVDGETQDIDTGNGFTAGGGIIQRLDGNFGIKYTAGYKLSSSAADNADILKSVLLIDVVPHFRRGDHRFGVGVTHHLSPKVDWDWLAASTRFDDATGLVLEYAYKRFSFSYTDIDYEIGPVALDAGHVSFKYSSRY